MKPIAAGGAIEFSCGAHSNNNINYSVPITCSTHMNFSPKKKPLISASSDLASSKYLSLHTNNLSRVKGSIDKLVCWLTFGAYGFVFVKKKHQTKNSDKCDFHALSDVKTSYSKLLSSFLHSNELRYIFWRKALDFKFPTYLSLDCLETNKEKNHPCALSYQ